MPSPPTFPPPDTQLSPLPPITRHITTHSSTTPHAVFHSTPTNPWHHLSPSMAFNTIYTTSVSPPSLTGDADLQTHSSLLESGRLGLVNPGGSVCRVVDFGPSTTTTKPENPSTTDPHSPSATQIQEPHSATRDQPLMHRTQSLDYGIVIEGEVECVLDSGEVRTCRRGDVVVQRGTMHAWRNTSTTQWARMFFVLLASEKLEVGGKLMEEEFVGLPEGMQRELASRKGEERGRKGEGI